VIHRPRSLHASDLRGSNFVGASLHRVNFSHSDLRGAIFGGAGVEQADLSGARLDGASLVLAVLRGASLSRAVIGDAAIRARIPYSGSHPVQCADLHGANLRGTDFRHARFCTQQSYGDYRHCRVITRRELTTLANADLTGARAPN
jgi:uncharacterized protein YjbI with pentapeptide repeats